MARPKEFCCIAAFKNPFRGGKQYSDQSLELILQKFFPYQPHKAVQSLWACCQRRKIKLGTKFLWHLEFHSYNCIYHYQWIFSITKGVWTKCFTLLLIETEPNVLFSHQNREVQKNNELFLDICSAGNPQIVQRQREQVLISLLEGRFQNLFDNAFFFATSEIADLQYYHKNYKGCSSLTSTTHFQQEPIHLVSSVRMHRKLSTSL